MLVSACGRVYVLNYAHVLFLLFLCCFCVVSVVVDTLLCLLVVVIWC